MTDRIKGVSVVLEDNIREDDAQPIIDAILQIRGVISVTKHITDFDHHTAKMQVKHEIRKKLFEVWDNI